MILLFFLLCGVAYGTDVHSDCYNHGSKDGSCECLDDYTGNNCELCKRCNYQGTCHGNYKVEGEKTDNDGTKECVCDKKPNGKFKWGGAECAVDAVCHSDSDCKRGTCVKNLCDCIITAGGPWSGDTCNIEPICPDGCFHGTCTMESGTTADTFGLIRAVGSGCDCEEGWGGVACDQPLVSECNDKGYLNEGSCACEEGYGDDCSCDSNCAWGNAESRTCPTGLCQCNSGYEQPDCTCTENQCSGHGTCSDSGCDCEEGWVNYQCSGHGECNDCTCHPRFDGEMCNVLKPMPTCEQGEHYMENGIYYEEGGACDVNENRNTFFGREYNLHPLQSIQYEATSWTDCHQKCMDRIDSNVIDESRDIHPIKFEDRYGWDGVNPSWVDKVWGHYAGVEEYYTDGDWFSGKQYFYEELDAPDKWYETNTNIARSCSRYDNFGSRYTECTFSPGSEYTRVWEETDYPNGDWHTSASGLIGSFFSGRGGVYFMKATGYCTTEYRSVIETTVYMDPTNEPPLSYQNVYKMQPICLEGVEGVDYPAIPKYYKRMDSFETEYSPTHYAYDNGNCTCFGLGEDTCGTTKDITYDPKRSGDQMTQWDNNQPNSLKEVSAPVQRKPGIISYWKRDGDYCMPCLSGYHNVSGTHCCPNGWEGNDCDININDCQGDPCNDNVHICVDDADAAEYNKNLSIGNYACVCKPGKTGTFNISTGLETCDKECCIDGENVTAHGGFTDSLTVHGTCKSGVGGCDCDYGYEGPKCECTDSMCDHGYCNVGGNTFCKCHPGYELDDTGKCTVGADFCASDPCVNHDTDDTELPICTNTENDYHCKCEVGYIGKNCTIDTEWNIGNTTCPDGYLLNGRCVDCPHGTYSRGLTDTTCRIILTDENIHDAVSGSDLYGDITTFDTSAVTNMDRLFKDINVPDISDWDVTQVTSMREMFMGATRDGARFDADSLGWDVTGKDTTRWDDVVGFDYGYAEVEICEGMMADITWTGYHNIQETETSSCSSDKGSEILGFRSGVTEQVENLFAAPGKRRYFKCSTHCGVLSARFEVYCGRKEASCLNKINGECMITSSSLRHMVVLWEADSESADQQYGPLATWDVSYVTDMTDLFHSGNPDITNWDMSNVVHADRMLLNSGFTQRIDNKDLSSLQTANDMMPTDYGTNGGHLCGKHFLRVCEARGYKADTDALKDIDCANRRGFENMGSCLTSTVPEGESVSVIKQAVNHWYDADKKTAIKNRHGEMSEWDVSQVQSMHSLFLDNKNGIPPLAKWDTSSVTDMTSMFENSDFNEDISHWDVRKVDKFNKMFKGNTDFAVDLTFWEIHASVNKDIFSGNTHYDGLLFKIDSIRKESLTDATFHPAVDDWFDADKKDAIIAEYGEISDWLVYEVTDMSNAFEGRTTFNEDISEWNVGAVTDMSSMFEGSAFNSPIGMWNVDKVRDMSSMFKGSSFNQLIDRWNVSSVEDMSSMFENSVFSRPIGDWDLWGTGWDIVQKPDDGNSKCFAEEGMIITLDPNTRQNLQSNYRLCFDECTGTYPNRLDDIEGRTRSRGGGEVGSHYTPYMAGFGFVENTSLAYTCQCATKIDNCVSSPFDRVLEYRDMKTDDMFTGNDKFIQPLCGIGWRYRDIRSLSPPQRGVSLTCDICNATEHMSTCGLCLGEFRFDHCLDSPMAFTLKELHDFGGSHGMTGLVVNAGGIPLDEYASDDDINNGYVNPYACNCEYEEGMKGCLVVNGRKQVRMKEWYADGEIDFSTKTITQYYCELDFLNNARSVASAEGFNSVECTEDTLLKQDECGLVGGNWNGKCDKCLKPCDPPELGVKYISTNRKCEKCDEGKTVWNNECVWCPDGKFTDENRAWCGKCPSGTYGANGACLTCAQGAASTFEGALQCSTCPATTFSVGTECQQCPTGKSSKNGAWSCYDVAHCRHGATTDKAVAGNWCDLCNDGFKLNEVGTCVADCVHGNFRVNSDGSGTCQCTDMWGQTPGDPWNACNYCDVSQYVNVGDSCHDTKCDDTLFTDCVCDDGPVINGKLCYDNKPYFECSPTLTENCLCNTGNGYEHVGVGYACSRSSTTASSRRLNTDSSSSTSSSSSQILCTANAVPTKDCPYGFWLNDGGTFNCTTTCSHNGYDVDSATHVVLDSNILPLCGGTKKTDCYGVPWKVMDYNCGAHVECDVNEAVNRSQTYNGMGNEDASSCCKKKQQCMDFTCPSTYAIRAGDHVLTRTEYGMCNGGEWYTGNAELYETAAQALQRCGLFTGESIIAHLDDKVFVCTQGFSNETANYAPTLQHQEDCDTWYSSLRFNGTYRTATTYTYQRSKPQDTYSTGLVFTTGEGDDTCCTEVCDGKHAGKPCARPIYGICGNECTAAHFATDGDEPSSCCEADSWYCDSGTCDYGFTKNSKYCGEKCDQTRFATTIEGSGVQAIPLIHGSVICEGEEQVGVDSSGCFAACNSFTNYFVIDDKCFCANNLGGQCTNNITDCSDWCPNGIVTQTYSSTMHFTACENYWDVCSAGWDKISAQGWCRKRYESGTQLSTPDPCVGSGTCCEPKMYDTYYISTDLTRTGGHCCDVDTSLNACMSKQCPDRYENNDNYDTKLYSSDHTTECCDQIPDIHYCDKHNNEGAFNCTDGRLFYDEVYCDGVCDEAKCCKPDDNFCNSIPCVGAEVETGLDYCGSLCEHSQCCKAPPKCDRSHNCDSGEIDWNYECTDTVDGVCAPLEYEDGKCCTTDLSPYCSADNRYDTSGAPSVSDISYAGDPMPGCYKKAGYISYYEVWGRTGVSFTDESFEGVCCNYVEACPSNPECDHLFPKGGYSASVPRHCASGSSSGWDRIQNCTDYSSCCEEETCATAQDRLGTQCYNSNWDNWDNVQSVQLTRSTFFETCCKSTCQQLQYEKAAGDRGHDLCDNSLNGEDVNVDLTNPKDIVDKCCENSCGKKAISNDWSCPNGTDKDPGYWTNYYYGFQNAMYTYVNSISDQTDFDSKCCFTSCNAVNGTYTCVGVENIKTWDHSNQYMYSIWYQARDPIVTFESTCCIDATCNNIVKQDNFRGNSCEDTYPGTYYNSQNDNTVLTDPSDPLPCCGGVASACKTVMNSGSRCGTGKTYASWVSPSITVTSDNFENSCCSFKCATENVDCVNLFPGSSWSNTHSMSNYDMRTAVCCGTEWQCDVYPDYKGWGSYYTSRDVNGTTYKAPNPVTAFSSEGGTVNVYARFLKYNESVTESGWAEKCHCPENDLDCLSDNITSSLTTTCQGKENSQGFTCDSVCASSSLNTCTNWLNIAEYGTKVWTGQITRTDYYAKNRFMMNCCEGANWVWDSSTNFRN